MPSTVTVHYPFHPLHKRGLTVLAWPRHVTGSATVQHPDGKTLKIPLWMLQPNAPHFALSQQIVLSVEVLRTLVEMVHARSTVTATTSPEHIHAASDTRSGRPCGLNRESPDNTRTGTAADRTDGKGHRRRAAKRTGRRS
jgi:hypothetical protein